MINDEILNREKIIKFREIMLWMLMEILVGNKEKIIKNFVQKKFCYR
jgi:hypothetical protein